MGLETATFINGLDATNPTSGDPKSQGDDHIRLVKSTIKATFPNVTGAVTPTHLDLNVIAGAASGYISSLSVTNLNTTTQATTDNSTKAASTAYVQNALLNASLSGQLPAQTGNAGRYLQTNGTSASWSEVIVTGLGGAAPSGNVTLTAASAGAQSITPTGYGQYVTLPDATTCNLSAVLFAIANKSGFPLGIKDAAGTILGWVPPQSESMVGLANKATAAGVWTIMGADPCAVTSQSGQITYSGLVQTVALDANRTFILLENNSFISGVVHDASTGTFGAQTTIRTISTVVFRSAVLSGTNQVLVCCAGSTDLESVVLSISGTTITVNTATATTLAGGITTGGQGGGLAAIGTTFVLWYGRATNVGALRALTISGTTVTVGAEVTTTPIRAHAVYGISSSVGIAFGGDATNLYAVPFSVSGATITLGTQASWAKNASVGEVATRVVGSRYIVMAAGANASALVSVSGTTATASTFTSGLAANDFTVYGIFDAQISATKWLIGSANTTTPSVGILTDNAGTASFSSITIPGFSPMAVNVIKATSSKVTLLALDRISYNTATSFVYGRRTIELNVSGATPSVVSQNFVEYTLNSSAVWPDYLIKTLALPVPTYHGAIPNNGAGSASKLPQERTKLSGAPGVLGVTASQGISVNGVMQLVCNDSGASFRPIPSLTLQACRDAQADDFVTVYRTGNYLGSDRRTFGIAANGNAPTNATVFCVECAA